MHGRPRTFVLALALTFMVVLFVLSFAVSWRVFALDCRPSWDLGSRERENLTSAKSRAGPNERSSGNTAARLCNQATSA